MLYAYCFVGLYVCCKERLHLFAILIDEAADTFAPRILLTGDSKCIYCYDEYEDAVFLLGNNFYSLARDGVRRMDTVYKSVHIPMKILHDPYMLSLVRARHNLDRVIAITNGVQQYRFYRIAPVFYGVDNLFISVCHDDSVLDHGGQVSMFVPGNDKSLICEGYKHASARIATRHWVIGWLANGVCEDVYLHRLMIIVDNHGIVYGYCYRLNSVYRLADNMSMFTRIVGQKSFYNFRFDRKKTGLLRLEKPPLCPHTTMCTIRVRNSVTGRYEERKRSDEEAFSITALRSPGEILGYLESFPDDGTYTPQRFAAAGWMYPEEIAVQSFVYNEYVYRAHILLNELPGVRFLWRDDIQGMIGWGTTVVEDLEILMERLTEILEKMESDDDSVKLGRYWPILSKKQARSIRLKLFKRGRGESF